MIPDEVPETLKRFVSSNPSAENGYDGASAEVVYGVVLKELQEAWYHSFPIFGRQCLLYM